MRFWLSKSSEVPIRVQLEAQIILGILSNDLKAGQRLPSTRDLARRYKIHTNTVSAVYRQLAGKGWVDFRKGSGVFVRVGSERSLEGNLPLDRLLSFFLGIGLDKGQSLREIQSRLRHWLSLPPPDHFLVIEPDPELRRIVVTEVEEATGARTIGTGIGDQFNGAALLAGAAPVALFRQAEVVSALLPRNTYLITLRSRSVSEALLGEKLPPADALIAIVSCWPEFLRWAHTLLVAGGVDPQALSLRDAREQGWENGLRSTAFVITDSLMAPQLPTGCVARVFRVVSDSSIAEVRGYCEEFFR